MKSFCDPDFLLSTPTAVDLFHRYAKGQPIIDYHCHISPREIAEDRRFSTITEVWLGGDHYKWRMMRANGVDEAYITGDADPREKFRKWAQTLGAAIGNPLYHWSHLELRRYFGYNGLLNRRTADEVYDLCNAKLAEEGMSAKGVVSRSNVESLCTTDDPVDTLEWHRKIAEDKSFKTRVLPAWRPDKAMNLEKPDYPAYLARLEKASSLRIDSYASLLEALCRRMDFFHEAGCRVADHAVEYVMYAPASDDVQEEIFERRLAGEAVSREDQLLFKTAFLLKMGREYARRDWAMQLHYGCKRDNNDMMFERLGPDTGYDCISNHTPSAQLADFLNALARTNELPRTIVYSLNPMDNQAIQTVIGCFQDSSAVGKLQHGSAWWFNDHLTGMTEQLTACANIGYLPGFIGMLTDSRSFLSYPRHEYFRRILCRLFGEWVEDGQFPQDYETLGEIVANISYHNAKNYFKLP